MNQLILGDNLEALKQLPDESVDLIYIDPPFFSNRNYEVIWGDSGEVRSFEDRWSGGMMQYIGWLKERVEELYRILKPTGSIFLHCDWHADAYIKILILDKLFGLDQFRAEIVWQRTNAHSDAKNKLAVVTDSIYYYSKSSKSSKSIYNPVYTDHSDKYKASHYTLDDDDGRGVYQLDNITAPAGGGMAAINKKTGKPNGWYIYNGFQPPERGWRYQISTMERLDSEGRIYFPTHKDGSLDFSRRPRLKRYLSEQKGTIATNIWLDIPPVNSQSKERIGYPTQKPEALMERIIKMATNEGDLVLDAFVGGGTTVAVADKLNRQWIGIDQSVMAIKVTENRLYLQQDLFSKPFAVQLHKYDYDRLFNQNPKEFETWIVQQYGGKPNFKKGGDKGIDGTTKEGLPIQVKQSENIGRDVLDKFWSACQRHDRALFDKQIKAKETLGVIIAFSFGRGAIEEAARLRSDEGVIIKLVSVSEIVPIAHKPKLKVTFTDHGADAKGKREIEFNAVGTSSSGIEFYAWDFDFNPESRIFKAEVMMDKTGVQRFKFKPGLHTIAAKVVDNEGLDALEVIRLKVNGEVKGV